MLAKAAGGPESLAPVPPTLSVSSTQSKGPTSPSGTQESSSSTGPSGTQESSGPTNPPGNKESNNGGEKPSHVGAIVGGVLGGLATLAVTGVGAWIFLRKRAMVQGDRDYPGHTKVPTDPPTSEDGTPLPHPRLYVR